MYYCGRHQNPMRVVENSLIIPAAAERARQIVRCETGTMNLASLGGEVPNQHIADRPIHTQIASFAGSVPVRIHISLTSYDSEPKTAAIRRLDYLPGNSRPSAAAYPSILQSFSQQ